MQVVPALWRAHWCRLLRVQDLPEVALALVSCVPLLLSALSLCPWCVAHKYDSISHFDGVFSGFGVVVWVCIVRVLCVACVAFVCVSG